MQFARAVNDAGEVPARYLADLVNTVAGGRTRAENQQLIEDDLTYRQNKFLATRGAGLGTAVALAKYGPSLRDVTDWGVGKAAGGAADTASDIFMGGFNGMSRATGEKLRELYRSGATAFMTEKERDEMTKSWIKCDRGGGANCGPTTTKLGYFTTGPASMAAALAYMGGTVGGPLGAFMGLGLGSAATALGGGLLGGLTGLGL